MLDHIKIRRARTHNLKNISLDIPKNQLVVITGLSGSGKSSLAFDTIFAEGQRRYVESLSAYARQFLSVMDKPEVDAIDGLSPAIAIEQKSTSHNPRSTVGTITEIYDYLRLLFARVGVPHCPTHGHALKAQTLTQVTDEIMNLESGTRWMLLAPISTEIRSQEYWQGGLAMQGFMRLRVDGQMHELEELDNDAIAASKKVEVVIDRFRIREDLRQRLNESLEAASSIADGRLILASMEDETEHRFNTRYACPECGFTAERLEPKLFSFNNPHGACADCSGLGLKSDFSIDRIVSDRNLSVNEGAIRGWDRRNGYYFQMLQAVAKHFDFDLDTPFAQLDKTYQDYLLYGTGDIDVEHRFINDKGAMRTTSKPFEGVVNNLKRRFQETQSSAVREELGKLMIESACPSCHGARLNSTARHVKVGDWTLPRLTALSILESAQAVDGLNLDDQSNTIAAPILLELGKRLSFLNNVGLTYLSLSRTAGSLSGGEAQRIRLASQIGSGLTGVMYVLDEPSIGLHQRDNDRLLETLRTLRDLGNTVIVVEHDEDTIRASDYVIDIGPGAGRLGGHVVAQGKPDDIANHPESLTGDYLAARKQISTPTSRRPASGWIELKGADGNNLQSVDIAIPTGVMTCITGVSGSGKSTLINETLGKIAARDLNGAEAQPAPYGNISGLERFDSVVRIDQSPIGRTPRSNPATYTGIFTLIRDLFAETQEARARGYQGGRFSFNVKGGRCESCQGDGLIKVEMHFLPDVYVPCEQCGGKRYNRETLEVLYRGLNIHDVLNLTVEEACEFFAAVPLVARRLDTLRDVGLSYIRLGQSATTLSGGEAQRIKLSKELSRRESGKNLYILDEPTTGLHFEDVRLLLEILQRLTEHGNTLVVIEHNLDVIKCADHIIDMGPEGGAGGGLVVATGTPEEIANANESITGHYLKSILSR
ncbi:MAG: excinuclease ABC subunit UvrA [Gammaproteobacteria bacterium]|nr:excinuclease ABC subunit UvrA [Gammaproteobacteria bacterium]